MSSGQTKQTTTDANGAISEDDRQWLANNGGALPISQVPAQDKALVGTGTGAAAHMAADTTHIGTRPLDNRAPGSGNASEDILHHSSGVGPYQRTPANYAGGPGPNANSTITLYAQKYVFYLSSIVEFPLCVLLVVKLNKQQPMQMVQSQMLIVNG